MAPKSNEKLVLRFSLHRARQEDLGCCPAELVLGTTIRLPGEMFANSQDRTPIDPSSYSARLKGHFRSILPTPTRLNDRPTHIHKDLCTCPFVFARVDTVKKPLHPPYDGPYKVLKHEYKYFILVRYGAKDSVSIEQLKPAYLKQTPKPESAVPTPPSSSTTQSYKDTILPSFPPTITFLSRRFFEPFSSNTRISPTRTLSHSFWPKSYFPSRLADYLHSLTFERFLSPLSRLQEL
nr:gag pol polyprotein [Hymenolepis microstoma]